MRGDLKLSMMPVAPAAIHHHHHPHQTTINPPKPKLGFSIESIVGSKASQDDDRCSDGSEVTTLTPPPAHQKMDSTAFYRSTSEDLYGGTQYHPQRVLPTRTASEYRSELVQPSPLAYPSVMSAAHYGQALSAMGHCHGQYPLASYLVNRDYSGYPWLMARQPRILPYRPQGGPQSASFILHQFRKPKRIRTAFSPSQLLTLEHAFEKNHYVVGTERKQLAQGLHLTETQVKVWFQNRRTKHKRQKQEEEQQSNPSSGQSKDKGETDSNDGRMSSPVVEESDESMCEDDEDCDETKYGDDIEVNDT